MSARIPNAAWVRAAAIAGAAALSVPGAVLGAEPQQLGRGKYLFDAGGCANCHTDAKNKGPLLAGGRALKTPFGTFYGPNITPHPGFGIGRWSDGDFVRAMREGVSPAGEHYYPAFPYTSYTRMTDRDLLDLKAYIFSLPPVARPSRDHEVSFPYNIRLGLSLWKALYFEPGPLSPDEARPPEWHRGRYLAEALTHCAECHTPRGWLGGLDRDRWMAGAAKGTGPDGEATPNITPDPEAGIGQWSLEEVAEVLKTGTLPDGDEVGSLMYDVVGNGTSRLTDADRRAIAIYLKSLRPIPGPGGGE